MILILQVTSFACASALDMPSVTSLRTVPQNAWKLLEVLKGIEKAFLTYREQPNKKGKVNPIDSNKHKMVSFHEPIPKKPHKDVKQCSLCKKHGGMHVTHNMSDC